MMQCPEIFVLHDKIEGSWLTQFVKCLELAKNNFVVQRWCKKIPEYIEDNLTMPIENDITIRLQTVEICCRDVGYKEES